MSNVGEVEWTDMTDVQWNLFIKRLVTGSIMNVVDLVHELTKKSKSECRRLIEGGAFRWNNIRLIDADTYLDIDTGCFYRANMKDLHRWAEEQGQSPDCRKVEIQKLRENGIPKDYLSHLLVTGD